MTEDEQTSAQIDAEIAAYCEPVANCDDPIQAAHVLAAMLWNIEKRVDRVIAQLSDVGTRVNAIADALHLPEADDDPQHTS